jgi:hypothetical protein
VKLVLFGLRPSDADRYITGGAFKGQCGLFTRDRRGAVMGVDRAAPVRPGPDGVTVRPRS